ncbi:MAG: caspase family protein [Pseudomonadota bacterium]
MKHARRLLAAVLALCLLQPALAWARQLEATGSVDRGLGRESEPQGFRSAPKLALVIGNGAYHGAPLRNPGNDAQDMAAALERAGFRVSVVRDGSRAAMLGAIAAYTAALPPGALSLVYYAGHGFQHRGHNYLVPVDARLARADDIERDAIAVDTLLEALVQHRPRFNVLVLDACRQYAVAGAGAGGLAEMQAAPDTLIAFATGPGRVASDGDGRNGLYTSHLLRHVETAGLSIEDVFKRVRTGVLEQSQGRQVPLEYTALTGHLELVAGSVAAAQAPPANAPLAGASEAQLRAYLAEHGGAAVAPALLEALVARRAENRLRKAALAASERFCPECPRMSAMGTATAPLWVGTDLITRENYVQCVRAGACRSAQAGAQAAGAALHGVSYDAARAYVDWLNTRASGHLFRIPSWDDWMLAYRAGYFDAHGKPLFGKGTECEVGNFYDRNGAQLNQLPWSGSGCADGFAQDAPVGMFVPSAEGVFDLVGNLWQWTSTCQDGGADGNCAKHRLAGGSWASNQSWPWDAPPTLAAEPGLEADIIGLRLFAARR